MKKLLALATLLTAAACVQHTFKSDDDDDDDDGSIWERPDGDGNSGAGGSGNTTSSTKSATSTKATSTTSGPTATTTVVTSSQVGPTATTTTGPTGCDGEPTCNDCQFCSFRAECSAEYNVCAGNPDCFALNDCLLDCTNQTCADQCVATYSSGEADLNALILCVFCDACYVTCDGADLGC